MKQRHWALDPQVAGSIPAPSELFFKIIYVQLPFSVDDLKGVWLINSIIYPNGPKYNKNGGISSLIILPEFVCVKDG